MTEEEYDEKYLESILERNPHLITRLRIHPWRWRFIAAWILIFTALVFVSIRQNRSAISQLNANKASILSLEKTNCALRSFLFAAYQARVATSTDKTVDPVDREVAKQAAEQYLRTYQLFDRDHCDQLIGKQGHIHH